MVRHDNAALIDQVLVAPDQLNQIANPGNWFPKTRGKVLQVSVLVNGPLSR